MNGLSWPDLAVVLLYLAGTTAVGFWVGRKNTSSAQFMTASGRLPGWVVGLSIFGTFVSSISFLALPGKAYGTDWNPFVFSLSIPLATWIAVRWFVPFYRHRGEISAYHHLEERFGPWARTYAVICYLLTQLGRMGTITFLLAIALQPMLDWPLWVIILVTGLVVMLYSFIGGIEAVIWTDALQSAVLIGGALACAGVLVFGLPNGTQDLASAAEAGKFGLGSYSVSLTQPTFWVVLIYGLVINLQNFGIDQSYVQRYATSSSDREASKSVWLGALLYLPVSGLFLFIGTALYAYAKSRPGLLPEGIADDQVFPWFIRHGLPVGVSGLLVAAIFAAAQSTLSSSVNCAATLIQCDLYRRYFKPDATDRESLLVLRASTLLFGAAGTAVAFIMVMAEGKSVLDLWWKIAGIFSGGTLGLFLLGMLSRRAGNVAALVGVALGVLVIFWMSASSLITSLPENWRSGFHDFLIPVFGTAVILLAGFLVTAFLPGNRREAAAPES